MQQMSEIQIPRSSGAPDDDSVHQRMLTDAQKPNPSLLERAVDGVVSTVWSGDSDAKKATESVISDVVKNVPLFIGGPRGLALSGLTFGLAETKMNDTAKAQFNEFVMGAAKGGFTKTAFQYIGEKNWGFAAKGMAMGGSARFLDTALTPSLNANGQLEIKDQFSKALQNAGDATALGLDAITFGAARFVPGVLPEAVARNAFLSSTAVGGAFGFTSGALGEVHNQLTGKDNFDVGKIVAAGGRDAAVMSLSAGIGHRLTPVDWVKPPSIPNRVLKAPDADSETTEPKDNAEKSVLPKSKSGYIGYFLDPGAVDKIQNHLVVDGSHVAMPWNAPSTFHVTSKFGINSDVGADWISDATKTPPELKVIGIATDKSGVQALHVSVDGETVRDDGRIYHITRSLADGRKAFESMDTIDKALKVRDFKQTGVLKDLDFADVERYSYKQLSPEDQFTVSAEPRYRETDTTPAKHKDQPAKPETPFGDLSPKLQVISALKNVHAETLNNIIAEHTVGDGTSTNFWTDSVRT